MTEQKWYTIINPADEKIYENYEISHFPTEDGYDVRRKLPNGKYKYLRGTVNNVEYIVFQIYKNNKVVAQLLRHIIRGRAV